MSEPILWCHKAEKSRKRQAKHWNPKTNQMEPAFDEETGEPLIERMPQRAHEDDGNSHNPSLVKFARWILYLRHDGHVVRTPITMGAADVENGDFRHYMTAKARHFGWIPWGMCPLAAVSAGQLKAKQIVSEEVRKGQACSGGGYGENRPCPHFLLEDAARKAHKAAQMKKDAAPFEDKALRAVQEQTKDLLTGFAQMVAEGKKSK